MENIRSLIQNLNSKELEVAKNYIHGFSSRPGDEEKKTWQLMKMILHDKKKRSIEEYSRNIYNTDHDGKLDKLKSRLKNKILDSLVLDINIDRRDAFDPNDNASLRISKKLVTVKYLIYSHQEATYITRLLNEIIDLALKYENYNALIETMNLKKKMLIESDFVASEELSKKIEYFTGCMNYLREVQDLFYIRIIGKMNNAGCNLDLCESIDKELERIRIQYEKFNSPLANYYKTCILYNLYKFKNDLQKLKELSEELIRIIPLTPSVMRQSRIGAAYLNLTETLATQENYHEAFKYCIESQKSFSSRSAEYLLGKEFEFNLSIHIGKIENARKCLTILQRSTGIEFSFRSSKYDYYSACVEFMEGNFINAYKILRRHQEISRDKCGWDISLRILTIQTCIELGYDAESSKYIELLRKQIKRKAGGTIIRKRNETVLKILMSLDKKSLNFHSAHPYCKELLNDLNSKDPKMNKIFNGPEVICFRQWFLDKLN